MENKESRKNAFGGTGREHAMNVALLLAGGSGSRLGAKIPKQYIEVEERMIISYCLETLWQHPLLDGIWIVAEANWRELIWKAVEPLMASGSEQRILGFSDPGQTRQLSIWNGLQDLKNNRTGMDTVLIHDAARPMVSAETITACMEGCITYDGVMPALPVKDTVYIGADGRIEALLDRSKVIAGQAPEAFRFDKYYDANRRLMPDEILKINGSTEPAILAGMKVKYIPGDERNFKITTMADLERFQEIIRRKDAK